MVDGSEPGVASGCEAGWEPGVASGCEAAKDSRARSCRENMCASMDLCKCGYVRSQVGYVIRTWSSASDKLLGRLD